MLAERSILFLLLGVPEAIIHRAFACLPAGASGEASQLPRQTLDALFHSARNRRAQADGRIYVLRGLAAQHVNGGRKYSERPGEQEYPGGRGQVRIGEGILA